ncbi:glycoside hydrolase superfamily, partial [Echria macrotheca]
MASRFLLALASAVAVTAQAPFQPFPDCDGGLLATNQVCNRTLSPPERAAALVAAMTTDEKLQNLVSKSQGAPRIGLPAYNWWSEALHGVAYAPGTQFHNGPGEFNSSTSFPMPLLMAATFDDDLFAALGKAIGVESRAFGNARYSGLDYWTPNVNPFKDPRWGRGSETPGEDVLLIRRYAKHLIAGLQGPDPKEKQIVATCKHYAGNDFEDWNGSTRHDFDAKVGMQDLAEYYLKPFQQCARDSDVGSIMCAYNAVNGVPSCANEYLLETVLRGHWGWTGKGRYITSDCEAVADVSLNHHYAATNAEGTAMCFEAGMDSSCEYEGSSDIPGAWSQGLLKIETVDRALKRLYEGLVRAGYFDGKHAKYARVSWKDVNRRDAQDVALRAARDGIVLLKNDGTLPLSLDGKDARKKVAMIGFWADAGDKLSGGYSGTPTFKHTPAFAARRLGLNISIAGGPVLETTSASDNWTASALATAQDADYIVYFGGLDTSAAGETKDRMTIDWPSAQLALLEKLAALNKPLVVVQMGDQVDDTPILKLKGVGAILWANWPGQDGGEAVMQLLTGARSPSGRLPVTQYPVNYTSLVPMTDMALRPSATNPGRTYRWYPTPIFPFGFGLHYTTFVPEFGKFFKNFTTADLVARCKGVAYPDTCPLASLPVRVKNTGKRTSDYVALAFVSGEFGPKPYPIKTLAAFTRLRDIKPGKTAEARLEWTLGDIARHDEQGNTVLYPGTYTVMLDEPTKATIDFTVAGEPVVLDKWPSP